MTSSIPYSKDYGDVTYVPQFNPLKYGLEEDAICPISYETLKRNAVLYHKSGTGKEHPFLEQALVKWVKSTEYIIFSHHMKNKCVVCINDVNWNTYIDAKEASAKPIKRGLLGAAFVAACYFFSTIKLGNQPVSPRPLQPMSPRSLIANPQCPNIHSYPEHLNGFSEVSDLLTQGKMELDLIDKPRAAYRSLSQSNLEEIRFLLESDLIDLSIFLGMSGIIENENIFTYLLSRASEEKDILRGLSANRHDKKLNRFAKLAHKLELIHKQNKTPEKIALSLKSILITAVIWNQEKVLDYSLSHYDLPLDFLDNSLTYAAIQDNSETFRILLKHGASIFSSEETVQYAYKIGLLLKPTMFSRIKNYFI
jgi:hypothetical protein